MIFIFGASGSGKSKFAEDMLCGLGKKRTYIATMKIYGKEEIDKIDKHRIQREGKNFKTIECFKKNLDIKADKDELVLFECMSNYLANNMFIYDGSMRLDEEIIDELYNELISLDKNCKELIIVGNDVFDTSKEYSKEVKKYIENLYVLQNKLMEYSREVIELVFGIPIYLKKNN